MDVVQGLLVGFSAVLTPTNLLFALAGCVVGMLVGVLPGVGQTAGIAILIPLTYHMPPVAAIVMLASIFYGAMYGGRITSILLNVPGETEAIATTFDGHPMARNGRGGPALSISALASFAGGLLGTLVLAVLAVPLSRLATNLGPPEHLALMILGLSIIMGLTGRSVTKALLMAALGLLLSQVGADPFLGIPRFTFGQAALYEGIPLLPLVMGLFGISDILIDLERRAASSALAPIHSLMPNRKELRASVGPSLRGSAIGIGMGLIPGMYIAVSTFASYVLEKRIAKQPARFGKGAVEGVAGPESANTSFANACFVPLVTIGIPSSAALAVLMGAFRIQGITPGPQMFRQTPEVAWGLIASMFVGNVMLLGLSLPLVGMWVSMLRVPRGILYPLILAVTMIGTYSVRQSVFDLGLLVLFSAAGYVLKKLDFPLAPTILAFVLGSRIEETLRQSLVISRGDFAIFVTRPIATGLLLASLVVVVLLARRPKVGAAGGPVPGESGEEKEDAPRQTGAGHQ